MEFFFAALFRIIFMNGNDVWPGCILNQTLIKCFSICGFCNHSNSWLFVCKIIQFGERNFSISNSSSFRKWNFLSFMRLPYIEFGIIRRWNTKSIRFICLINIVHSVTCSWSHWMWELSVFRELCITLMSGHWNASQHDNHIEFWNYDFFSEMFVSSMKGFLHLFLNYKYKHSLDVRKASQGFYCYISKNMIENWTLVCINKWRIEKY